MSSQPWPFPIDLQSPEVAAVEGYPLTPYGMGDCRTFLEIPPLVYFEDGSACVNPDYDAIHKYHLYAVALDPTAPAGTGLQPAVTIPPGATIDFQLTVEQEENVMGHFLINELLMFTDPESRIDSLLVFMKNLQEDKLYTNAPVPALTVFGNAQLNCCLPTPVMLYPTQTIVFSVTNVSAPPVPITVQIVARGKRFLPYHNQKLVKEMERCWSYMESTPYWLTFDADLGIAGVNVPAGPGPAGTARGQMTVPGSGFFELIWPRVQVVPTVPLALTADDIDVSVTYGRVGKQLMDGPISLGAHFAVETKIVPGFPGNLYRAASACHCPPPTQFVRANTRINHFFQNRSAAAGANIRLVYMGVMHYSDRCPPQEDLDLVRRYGHGDANALKRAQEEGDKIYLSFFQSNPLYAETPKGCAPASAQAQVEADRTPGAAPPPAPLQLVALWRPDKQYYGPGSTGALPWHQAFARDQHGRVHVVSRDPNTNQVLGFAAPSEIPAWAKSYMSEQSGLSGSPAKGEWEAL